MELKAETELRCDIKHNEVLTLRILEGSAEIFGAEMALNKDYCFRGRSFAVFTWHGCKLTTELSHSSTQGSTSSSSRFASDIYATQSSSDSPMVGYVNTHIQLEARRDVALANNDRGPRVMVVGPPDQGKTTICQLLSNYALRLDREPVYVDLDVNQGVTAMPGCVSAVPLNRTALSVDSDYSNSTTTPLVYSFGHTDPSKNLSFYKHVVSTLASRVKERLNNFAHVNAAGLVVDTYAWKDSDPHALHLLKFCINAFDVDIVIVVGSDKLHSTLSSQIGSGSNAGSNNNSDSSGSSSSSDAADEEAIILNNDADIAIKNKNVIVVKLTKSGGVVSKTTDTRREIKRRIFNEYFYGKTQCIPGTGGNGSSATSSSTSLFGTASAAGSGGGGGSADGTASTAGTAYTLAPARLELKLSSLNIVNVGGIALDIKDGMRSVGDTTFSNSSPLQVVPARLTEQELKCSMLALVHSSSTSSSNSSSSAAAQQQQLISNNVSGFLYVIEANVEANRLVVLAPGPGELPSKFAILGSIKHMEL